MRASFVPVLCITALAIGCTPAEEEVDVDPDRDGLTTDFEAIIGTDAENIDSDGDGHFDAIEYLQYFDPTNADDYPYEGEWARGPLPSSEVWDGLSAEDGWEEGEFSRSWTKEDQFGQEIKLRRFYGNVILIDFSAEWCGPCRAAAETLRDKYEDRRDRGFVILQVMLDGYTPGDGQPDLDRWASDFDLNHTLIGGRDAEFEGHYMPGNAGIPNYTIIGRDFTIESWYQAGGEPNWTLIDSLIDEEPPEVEYPMPDNADYLIDFYGLD